MTPRLFGFVSIGQGSDPALEPVEIVAIDVDSERCVVLRDGRLEQWHIGSIHQAKVQLQDPTIRAAEIIADALQRG